MSDKNVDYINQLMLTNPALNPFGCGQHLINPTLQPNALDSPILTNGLLIKQNKDDTFEKQDAKANETKKKADVNFKGANENVGAYYLDSLKAKKKNASILSLMGFGTVISSLGAYKFSELGKKYPTILLASMAIGTIGGLLGVIEMSKASKELNATEILNTKV